MGSEMCIRDRTKFNMIPLFIGWERKFLAFFWSESLQHYLSTSLSIVPTREPLVLLPRWTMLYRFRGNLDRTLCESLEGSFRLGPWPANLNISDRFIILYLFSYSFWKYTTSLGIFLTYSSLLRKEFQSLDEILETVSQPLH